MPKFSLGRRQFAIGAAAAATALVLPGKAFPVNALPDDGLAQAAGTRPLFGRQDTRRYGQTQPVGTGRGRNESGFHLPKIW